MYNVTLSKIQGGYAIRTDVTTGTCNRLPAVGQMFEMFVSSGTSSDNYRWITTSSVKSVSEHDKTILFKTQNSTYRIDIE